MNPDPRKEAVDRKPTHEVPHPTRDQPQPGPHNQSKYKRGPNEGAHAFVVTSGRYGAMQDEVEACIPPIYTHPSQHARRIPRVRYSSKDKTARALRVKANTRKHTRRHRQSYVHSSRMCVSVCVCVCSFPSCRTVIISQALQPGTRSVYSKHADTFCEYRTSDAVLHRRPAHGRGGVQQSTATCPSDTLSHLSEHKPGAVPAATRVNVSRGPCKQKRQPCTPLYTPVHHHHHHHHPAAVPNPTSPHLHISATPPKRSSAGRNQTRPSSGPCSGNRLVRGTVMIQTDPVRAASCTAKTGFQTQPDRRAGERAGGADMPEPHIHTDTFTRTHTHVFRETDTTPQGHPYPLATALQQLIGPRGPDASPYKLRPPPHVS
ncbi:hypothetical protein PLESTF_001141400 [Pleodorina starrii]|nr:hypothetical protein PLESTF_001141400 [Pleodorina starrii]